MAGLASGGITPHAQDVGLPYQNHTHTRADTLATPGPSLLGMTGLTPFETTQANQANNTHPNQPYSSVAGHEDNPAPFCGPSPPPACCSFVGWCFALLPPWEGPLALLSPWWDLPLLAPREVVPLGPFVPPSVYTVAKSM